MRTIAALLAAVAFAFNSLALAAEPFPSRLVRIVVPYPAGGGTDNVARPLAQRLSERWGQPVIIENRAGAGTVVGTDAVVKAPGDGYTLLFSDSATFAINPHVFRNLPYDPLTGLAPVSIVCRLTPAIVINAKIPATSLSELIALAKKEPRTLSYGSFGNGTYAHVAVEEFKRAAGIEILHVPYRGGAPAIADLLGGNIAMMLGTMSSHVANEAAGRVRILATSLAKRPTLRPNLPTIGETVPGYAIDVWFALAAPASTPPEILDAIQKDVQAIVNEPEFREKFLNSQFLEPVGNSRAEFAAVLKQDSERWRGMVERNGIKID